MTIRRSCIAILSILVFGRCAPPNHLVGANDFVSDGAAFFAISRPADQPTDIIRIDPATGKQTVLVERAADIPSINGIAVDATHVYYDSIGSNDAGRVTDTLYAVPKNGGQSVVLITLNDAEFVGYVSDGGALYWSAGPSDSESTFVGGLVATPLSGGAANTLVPQVAARQLVVNNGVIYFAAGDLLQKIDVTGGTVTTLATSANPVTTIAVDDTNLYWISYLMGVDGSTDTGALNSVPLSGGDTTVLANGLVAPGTIARYGTAIYWEEYGGFSANFGGSGGKQGSIKRVPIAGGQPQTIVDNQVYIGLMEILGDRLYWTANGNFQSMKL